MSAVGLPPHILALFQARPPLEFIKPPKRKKMAPYTGIAEYVDLFETTEPPTIVPYETPKAKKERLKNERIVEHELKLRQLISTYDPHANSKSFGDPFKTLFVARINYDTTEKKLKREFEEYGSIRKIRMVCDKNNKPRGYAFIEFESDRYMKEAYKQADGRKIDGRRVLVDVERGRTIAGWLPRRFGGGRGPARGNVGKSRASMLAEIVNSLKSNVFCTMYGKENSALDELIAGGAAKDKTKAIKHEDKDRDRKDRKERDKERSDRKKDKRAKSKDRDRKRSRSRDKDRRRDRSRSKDKERDRERRRDRDER